MSKFCPVCLAEFGEKVITCPTDAVALVAKKPKEIEQLVDIYAASSKVEAERIVAFLQKEGIVAKESQTGISQIPVASDTHFMIAVLKASYSKAKKLIEQAQKDNIISQNGIFL